MSSADPITEHPLQSRVLEIISNAKAKVDPNDVISLAEILEPAAEAAPERQSDTTNRAKQIIQAARARVDRAKVEKLADELEDPERPVTAEG